MEAKTGYILNWTMLPCDDCTLIAGYFLKSGWGVLVYVYEEYIIKHTVSRSLEILLQSFFFLYITLQSS